MLEVKNVVDAPINNGAHIQLLHVGVKWCCRGRQGRMVMVHNTRIGWRRGRHARVPARRRGVACGAVFACVIASLLAPVAFAEDRDLEGHIIASVMQYSHQKLDAEGKPVLNDYGNPVYTEYEDMPKQSGNGQEWYDVDLFDHPDWQYRLRAEYRLPAGYLTEADHTVVYRVPEGFDLTDTDLKGDVTSPEGRALGTYAIDPAARTFTVTFNQETIASNRTSAVDGWLQMYVGLNEDLHKHGGTIGLPGPGAVVQVGKNYSIDVEKRHEGFDAASRTLRYTVTVSSTYGTPGRVHFSDQATNASIDLESVQATLVHADGTEEPAVWTDADGVSVDDIGREGAIDAYLPQLGPGERLELTYTAADPPVSGNAMMISNHAQAESSNSQGQTVSDDKTTDYWYDARTDIRKQGKGVTETGDIIWEVEFNEWRKNLNGWMLSDVPGDHQEAPHDLTLYVREPDGSQREATPEGFSLPYTFTQDDTNRYVLTYKTTPVGDAQERYTNKAQLCAPDQVCSDAWAEWRTPRPFSKTAGTHDVNTANGKMTATLPWTVSLGSKDPGITATGGTWTFTDDLQQHSAWIDGQPLALPHLFTGEQQQGLREAVSQAFRAVLPEATVTVAFTHTDGNATGFTITCDRSLPDGTVVTFAYSSTADLGAGNVGWQRFDNCVQLNGLQSCASSGSFDTTWNPESGDGSGLSITKMDGLTWQTGDTAHEWAELPVRDGERYLSWGIDVQPSNDVSTDGLTIEEQLPEGMHLLLDNGLSFRWDSVVQRGNVFRFDDHGNATLVDVNGTPMPGDVAHAHWDETTRIVTITLEPAMFEGMEVTSATIVRLSVHTGFDVPAYTMDKTPFTNTVTAWVGDKTVTAQQTQAITRDAYHNLGGKQVMNKIPQYNAPNGVVVSNKAVYQLSVNPGGICVGAQADPEPGQCTPTRVAFTDTMTYYREIGYDNGELVLDQDSVHVYTPVADGTPGSIRIARVRTNGDGSAQLKWCNTGTSQCQGWNPQQSAYEAVPETETVTVRELALSEYSYTVESSHPTDFLSPEELEGATDKKIMRWTNTLRFSVPNAMPIIVDYSYTALADHVPDDNGVEQEPWIRVDNTLQLDGYDPVYAPADNQFAVHVSKPAAGAAVTSVGVTVRKVDAGNNGRLLDGARFRLERWDAGQEDWVSLPEDQYQDVAAEGGVLDLGNGALTYNQAYRLTELAAPEGYAKAEEPLVFVIDKLTLNEAGESVPDTAYPWTAPDGFDGRHVANTATLFFANAPQPELPAAGGAGSSRLPVVAGTMLLAAAMACAVAMRFISARHACTTV